MSELSVITSNLIVLVTVNCNLQLQDLIGDFCLAYDRCMIFEVVFSLADIGDINTQSLYLLTL